MYQGCQIYLLSRSSQEVIMIVRRMETPATRSQGTRRRRCSDQMPTPMLAEDQTKTMRASRPTHSSQGCRDTVMSGGGGGWEAFSWVRFED